jgi:hypothetical protein
LAQSNNAAPNNSLNASGGSIPVIIIPASWLAWVRAAALIRALDSYDKREIKMRVSEEGESELNDFQEGRI